MAANGVVVTPYQEMAVVTFTANSILDGQLIEEIGRDLYALVDEQARRKLILDFNAVRMLSSQMLGVLITLKKKAAAIKGRVVLCSIRPDLLKVFTLTKLDKVLEIVKDEGEAMSALGGRS